jgi:glycosyltransferase involved in cell wall biosynthesis
MRVSAFTFVRDAVRLDYPVVESISSVLPLADELVVNVGDCDDGTLQLVESIGSPKLRIVRSRWESDVRTGGRALATQADLALSQCSGDWAVYIQADEVLHENDLPAVKECLQRCLNDPRVEGVLFDFVHFYGNYHTLGAGRKWYRREVRVVRTETGVRAWKDAQGFRIDGRKLRVVHCGARVYHYGWVREPAVMKRKTVELARWWHDDETVRAKYMAGGPDFPYDTGGRLAPFEGTHPAVMAKRIESARSRPRVVPTTGRPGSIRERLSDWLELRLGWAPGRYANYTLLGSANPGPRRSSSGRPARRDDGAETGRPGGPGR